MHAALRASTGWLLMPVTEQQARAIAFLAVAARPAGARKWDEAGVCANVLKVRDRSLASVVIATMQAADDRGAESPGVIPTNGPHWKAPEPGSTTPPPEHVDPIDRCSVCSLASVRCRQLWADDHEFRPSHRKPEVDDTEERVKAMKQDVACQEPVAKPVREHKANPQVESLRAAKAAGPSEPLPEPPPPEADRLRAMTQPEPTPTPPSPEVVAAPSEKELA